MRIPEEYLDLDRPSTCKVFSPHEFAIFFSQRRHVETEKSCIERQRVLSSFPENLIEYSQR